VSFCPKGCMPLLQARDRVGRSLYGERWDGCPSRSEVAALHGAIDNLHKDRILARQRELWPARRAKLSATERRRRSQLQLDDNEAARYFVRLDDGERKAIADEIAERLAESLAREHRCSSAKAWLRGIAPEVRRNLTRRKTAH
jgi:hypothetical protein